MRKTLAARERLRLSDTPHFMRDLERAGDIMRQRQLAGEPSQVFSVDSTSG